MVYLNPLHFTISNNKNTTLSKLNQLNPRSLNQFRKQRQQNKRNAATQTSVNTFVAYAKLIYPKQSKVIGFIDCLCEFDRRNDRNVPRLGETYSFVL